MDGNGDGDELPERPFATGDPPVTALRDRILDHLIGLVADLRRRGAHVPADGAIDGARALAAVGLDDADRARAALRAAIVTREQDVDTFDALFPEFWRSIWGAGAPDPWEPPEMQEPPGIPAAADATAASDQAAPTEPDADEAGADGARSPPPGQDRAREPVDDDAAETAVTTAVYSPSGPSRPVAQEQLPVSGARPDPLAVAVAELGAAIATRKGRRWSQGGTDRVDARQVLRRSVTTGGVVSELPRAERARTETTATLLVDVSQSVLDTIDRSLLVRMLAEAHASWRRVRTFFFDTDLREVTDVLDRADPDRAMAALDRAEAEWGGGTRIGHAIEAACRATPPPIDRDTAVFVISDGLEVGEIDRLERAMATLDRRARLVLWLNPLAGDPAFEPACRGMQAALPHVDGLFAFASAADLREIARQLRQRGPGGRIGYEFDPRRIAATTADGGDDAVAE